MISRVTGQVTWTLRTAEGNKLLETDTTKPQNVQPRPLAMDAIYCPTLNDLVAEVSKLENAFPKDSQGIGPELLFRGQGDSGWSLETTLERAGREQMSLSAYYRLAVHRVRPAVETFIDTSWEIPNYSVELEKSFRNDPELFTSLAFPSPGFYQYLIYLRHHGFPSPLLDWTSSIYIAVFFAFRNISTSEKRSIYVYCERPHGIKGWSVSAPAMRAIGSYIAAHPRHYRQRSDYTMCMAFDQNGGGWTFRQHDLVFGGRGRQDYLWKFDLPSTERMKILGWFDEFNLNAFSLFDSNEALLEAVWLREHHHEP